MQQIGFKNFRRFKELEEKDLGDITILVGGNNAGKSTLVKGLLLVLDNLKDLKSGSAESPVKHNPEFRFDANEYHDLGIGTFGRALYNKRNKDEICFFVRLSGQYDIVKETGAEERRNADFSFTFYVSGDVSNDQTTGSISRLLVKDNTRQIGFDFNYDANRTYVVFAAAKNTASDLRTKVESRIAAIKNELEACYNESQILKAQISEKQAAIKDAAKSNVELQEELTSLSREYAEYANYLSIAEANTPESIQEINEVSKRMAVIQEKQRELRAQQELYAEKDNKLALSKLTMLNNNTLVKIAEKNAELDKLQKSLDLALNEKKSDNKATRIELENSIFLNVVGSHLITNQIDSILYYAGISSSISDVEREDPEKYEAWQNTESDKAFIHEREGILQELSEDLSFILNGISAEYIYAHSAAQNVFYDTANKNDYVAKAIHRYCRDNKMIGSVAHTFVKTWMKKFGIGDDFLIESYGGEAYRFYIFDGKEKMDLADKGMGSNQLMILLISLASIIHNSEYGFVSPFIIIEEPEQNLHPDLQGLLTELLAYVNDKYHFKFIVETHSEYMIRRSQVLVAKGQFKDEKDIQENCPFKVYYFPKDDTPYDMEYTPTGRFARPFGKNFYDASAQDSIALNKLEMEARNK